jgi:HEAT repeat protein
VAKALNECAKASVPSLASTLSEVLPFIVTQCLFDPIDRVREMFVEAGCEIMNKYGKEKMNTMMPVLQRAFDDDDSHVDKSLRDKQFAGVILMLSLLATHAENAKTSKILDTMIVALRTPSELVQKSCAKHLPALIRKSPENAETIVNTLMKQLFEQLPATYGSRRGGAFGLAGVVKGLRITALKKYNILDRLVKGIEDVKGPWEIREGALMALEVMFSVLGMIFEPYAIANLPILLGAVSDRKRDVQLAAQDAAKAMMKNLSDHGVKQVLPKLIPSLQERKWQTKFASIKMLGAMAYCAPKHLSSSLPKLVPHLIDAAGSTHTLVQRASHDALKDIGHVIRNPEIQALVPTLIKALTKPVDFTLSALEALTQTAFVHSVDAPSLALIVPILERALRGRDGETKKRAALIFGSLGKLIGSSTDIEPYMPLLMPQLRAVVVDPIPDIRAVAARALGSLFESLGETHFPDLINWLISTLYGDEGVGTVERRGAAQSLAAVMSKLPEDRNRELLLEKLLPAIQHPKSNVREGVLWLLNFLPTSVRSEIFVPLLGDILPAVVSGLCDDTESVRDTALHAGRVVVEQYAQTPSAIDKILPVLERGMFLPDHRMRVSSVELLGDMLYKIGDTRAVHTDGEDDTHGTEQVASKIAKTLGSTEKRDGLLAALYITRSDTSVSVRHSAKVVWKTIVPNSGRVLREILSEVIRRLLSLLRDKSEVAGRCLGDLVSKLGERVIPEVLPILERSYESSDAGARRAVCMCVREIVANAHKKIIEDYSDQMLSLVLSAICDVESEVRDAAAKAFNRLQMKCGQEIVQQVIPHIVRYVLCVYTHTHIPHTYIYTRSHTHSHNTGGTTGTRRGKT